jgi:hypothetical protein
MRDEAPAYISQVTRLRRAKRGDFIHRADCPRANLTNTLPWLWAEERSDDEVRAGAAENGLHLCRVCKPLYTTVAALDGDTDD